ncbi:MAG: hypothetical protein PHS96_05990 [Anaerolineales bacterium]|nr:hypothetical protein [Anaerolineales bacterium]
MPDSSLNPNLEQELTRFYASAAPEAQFVAGLRQQVLQAATQHDGRPRPLAARLPSLSKPAPAWSLASLAILLLIVLVLAAIGPQRVLAQVRDWLGFIPGFGFTTEGAEVNVLSQPVELARGGLSLRLENAVSDSQRVWIELRLSGLPDSQASPGGSLLLSDGEKLPSISGTGELTGGQQGRFTFVFPALPLGARSASLLIEGLAGVDYELPFTLRPLQPGEMIPAPQEPAAPLQSESRDGVRLVLDHVAVDSQKTVFQVSLRFDQPNAWVSGPWNVALSDESGRLYPLSDVTPSDMDVSQTRLYQTGPFNGNEQLVLKLASFPDVQGLPVMLDLAQDGPAFTFDPGTAPQVGQVWELNQSFSVAGFEVKVLRAGWTGGPGLAFEVKPGPAVTGVMFSADTPLLTGSTGGVPSSQGLLSAGVTFSAIPEGPFEVRLMRLYTTAQGPWSLVWQPPAAPAASITSATPTPAASLPPLPTPTLAADGSLLRQVQLLARQFDAPFQQGPGWAHVIKETLTDPRAGQTFPPPYIKTEEWYEIDPIGYVARQTHTDFAADGGLVQQSATVGNYSINLTTGDSGVNPAPPYRFSADLFSQDLAQAISTGAQVSSEESDCEAGHPCLVITLLEAFPDPVQNPGESVAVSGAGRRLWVDLTTGQQVQLQAFWLEAGGQERIQYTQRTLLVEKVAKPPLAILDLLMRVIVP